MYGIEIFSPTKIDFYIFLHFINKILDFMGFNCCKIQFCFDPNRLFLNSMASHPKKTQKSWKSYIFKDFLYFSCIFHTFIYFYKIKKDADHNLESDAGGITPRSLIWVPFVRKRIFVIFMKSLFHTY